jgi:lysine 6-dehydrogenase
MSYHYVVLGAGRQGAAASYDLVQHGEARRVLLADRDDESARRAAGRINSLLGGDLVTPVPIDVTEVSAVERLLAGADAALSAVPYYYNLGITQAALGAGVSICDLGGNIDIARQQHGLDPQARAAGLSVIPNCGQVPGMGTSLMVYVMELLDEAVDVCMWDGGIPQHPRPPFNYLLTFNIEGLTNEYAEPAIFLRDGKITEVEPMTELEMVEFAEPIGTLEAFVAGGGTDTMPWTFEGRLRTLQNLTLRYPGHLAQLRAFYDLGLWSVTPVEVRGVPVVPRDVFHALFEPKVTFPEDRDIVLVRVLAKGTKDGRAAQAQVEVIDYADETTGFTAMERCTGWSAAIVTAMMARKQTRTGAGGVESLVPARAYVEELGKRGIRVTERVTPGGSA